MSTSLRVSPAALLLTPTQRIASIDLIRGAVMVLMAIDHVRVYSGLPAGGPAPGIFFTRWITHFCAPAFIFLAGTSAFFYDRKHADLSRFLLIRGAWLVLLELTFLRLAWTFNFDFKHYEMAGVIWVIGWCMILLAGLVKLPLVVVGTIGVAIIAAHNLIDPYLGTLISALRDNSLAGLWKILYIGFFAGPIRFGTDGPNLIVLYSIVPWIGVMAAGYAFGKVLILSPARRNRICLAIGLGAIVLFLVLRGFNLYGDPRPWKAPPHGPNGSAPMPALLAFLNTTKYPASLDFLLMTLGPIIALVPLLEGARGVFARGISVFGRVPFFFYMLHIPLIHALAVVVSKLRLGQLSPWLFANHPMGNPPPPDGYTWNLGLLYVVWVVAIGLLYFPCRWIANLKAKRKDWWLSYL
ncbi:MAG TPA: heparan-alpha-glucosaminide N-acetyltransferase domain-containing protein [Candidatus Dormibacteraeota bacterium]|nr:heparan-alpha-glucosaminide N-acetyltransferase domain-containing protein [Candidatus Dormibacteraeota bacterium]